MAKKNLKPDSRDTVYQVCIKDNNGQFSEVPDSDGIPKQVILQIVNGKWKPITPNGVDFMMKKFDALFRDEELVVSYDKIFNPNLGTLSFIVHQVDISEGVPIINAKRYFLLPILKKK